MATEVLNPDTLAFWSAVLAAAFWVPVGILLIMKRNALVRLADIPEGEKNGFPPTTVVIPARNEQRNLREALQSVLRLDYPDLQIVVVNDRSTDGTAAILGEMAKHEPRLTVMQIDTLLEGWLGKTYALHCGSHRANGEFILFTDADIVFHPLALRKAMRHVQEHDLDHLTIIPEDIMPGFFLRVVSATFGLFLFILFQPWEARNPRSRKFMGIGAFNLVRQSTYTAIGGHQAIALRPDDDLKFGKLIKLKGYRQDVLNGRGMVSVEWYRSIPELIEGLMKNMFAGMEYRVSLVCLATIGSLLFHLWPWFGVWVTAGPPQGLLVLTLFMMITSFGFAMAPFGVKAWQGLLLPFTIALLVYIQCRAMCLTLWNGGIYWRGTFYSLRELKTNKV